MPDGCVLRTGRPGFWQRMFARFVVGCPYLRECCCDVWGDDEETAAARVAP